jgi:DNA replication protein DnaC
MSVPDVDLDKGFKRLSLASARRIWRDLCQRAETEKWGYEDFLKVLVSEEIAQRHQTRVQRVSNRARFPFLKTVDDFDFTLQSTLRLSLLGSALSADFVTEGRNLLFSGKPGRGKTHLAIAVAYRAVQNGFHAHFATCAALIDDLSSASRAGRLREALDVYTKPDVLVIDEVGYLTYGPDAANVLFHVVNDRHLRKKSMIFTTNKALDAWGAVLHDPDLAEAIVDRVLERGRHLVLDGPSMRTKHLEKAGAGAIFSGNQGPSFPEPTRRSREPPERVMLRRAPGSVSTEENSRVCGVRGRGGNHRCRRRPRQLYFAKRLHFGTGDLPGRGSM